ncbi:MAG TPA: hypothetical protein VMD29_00630, partial [Terracidiphilus sp.]|nr:hypothetical protein [Terracidiphilus sp.]
MRLSYIPPIGLQPLASSGSPAMARTVPGLAHTKLRAGMTAVGLGAAHAAVKIFLAIFTVTAPDIYIYISFLFGAYIQGTSAVTV